MIDAQALVNWCGALVSEVDQAPQAALGPMRPELEFPDNLVLVTMLSGSGTEMEGVVRRPAFQVSVRGLFPYYSQLQAQANTIDLALMFGNWPLNLWGTRILTAEHVGGEPAPRMDDMQSQRVVFDCSYIVREIL